MEGATTRDRIVAAALAGFARRGVEATSLDDVAAAVGVRKQTVLYWFRSKDALVRGVVEAAVDELGRALEAAVAAAHRKLAFAACDALVDRIKTEVPIWKEQRFADGSTEWVGLDA